MNLQAYAERVCLYDLITIDKACVLAYYYFITEENSEFTVKDLVEWFNDLHLAKPNVTRLKDSLKNSGNIISNKTGQYKLHGKCISEFKQKYDFLMSNNEEVILNSNEVLPETLYLCGRTYIESLAKQINASYENNISDGCAVLMRRLLEILLIHSYENHGITDEIMDKVSNQYIDLVKIIENAKTNKHLSLSRNTKSCLDDFRKIGNFAAHKIFFTTQKDDIKRVIVDYRACIQELFYKSGIRK